jgi:hypothetical protein
VCVCDSWNSLLTSYTATNRVRTASCIMGVGIGNDLYHLRLVSVYHDKLMRIQSHVFSNQPK